MRNFSNNIYALEMYEYRTRNCIDNFFIRKCHNKQLEPILGKDRTLLCMVLISFAVVIFTMIIGTFITSAYAEDHILYVCVDEDSFLSGRAEPTKHSERTMRLYKGDEVEVVKVRNDGWIEIVGGETGTSFVDARYVSETLESFKATNVSGGRVKVRECINGKVVNYVKKGATVTISQTIFGWGRTKKGWVNLGYFDY